MRVRLVVFGGFEVRLASGDVLNLPTKKARALLGYLAVRPGQPHPRDKLATLLWGDRGDAQARSSLRQSLATLKRTFASAAPSSLLLEGKNVALNPEEVEVDVATFERLVAEGTPAALEEAVALYDGELLEGFDPMAAPFEEWLLAERERLRELALQALAKLLRYQSEARAPERAIQTALRLLALDPLQEPVHRTLMRLYARQGRRANALRQYQVCVGVLQRELGVEPEPGTRQVYQEILQHPARSTATPELPAAPRRLRRGPFQAPQVPTLEPPLVGRRTELAHLQGALDQAGGGSGRTVVVLGEAGIGKTRLLEALAATTLEQSGRILMARCYETEQILPFGPWVEVLRAGLEALERNGHENLDAALRTELARLLPELADPELTPTGPADDYLRLFGAVARVIEILAGERLLVLILEDLHWADEMSVRLLGFLARRLQAWRILLVASARVEELSEAPLLRRLLGELRGQHDAVLLTLTSLSEAETYGLVHVLTRVGMPEAVLGQVAKQVWALSEGNPFVVVETIRALHEGHRFEASTIALPARVREGIAGRLERLSPRARDLVAVAAVIGREFEFRLLEGASGLDPAAAADGVEELVRRGILHGIGERLDFTHDLIREVAYGRLLDHRRKLLHRQVASALDEVYAGNLGPHYAALGLHYRESETWDKAAAFLHQAGKQAAIRSAHREAVTYFEAALASLARIPETPGTLEQQVAIRVDLGPSLMVDRGAGPEAMDNYTRGWEICARLPETPHLFPILWGLSRTSDRFGQPETALRLGEQLLAVAERSGDQALLLQAHHALWGTSLNLGHLASARVHAEQGLALYDRAEHRHHAFVYGGHDPAVCGGFHAAGASWLLGYPDQALSYSRSALGLARELAYPGSLEVALPWAMWVHVHRGEPRAARELADEALTLAGKHGFHRTLAEATLGWFLICEGETDEGLAKAREALATIFASGRRREELGYRAMFAEACLRAREIEEGLAVVDEALPDFERGWIRYYQGETLRIKGELLLALAVPDREHAEECFRQAITLAQRQEAKSFELRAATSLARLLAFEGRRDEARRVLAEIYGWFTEGFDTADLSGAQSLLDRLGGPP